MTNEERVELYKKFETIRKKPVIVIYTSIRPNAPGIIAQDIIPHFIKQIERIPKDVDEVDLIVISNGGDPTASLKIISLLREQFTKITIFIPYSAYSAATLIALGCNEIYMHPYGNLGPVDPQISIPKKNPQGIGLSFSAEDIQHYINFIKDDIGIKKEPGLEAGLNLLCDEVSPTSIGFTRKSIKLSHSMGRKLLMMHMFNEEKVKSIIEELNSS